MLHRERERRASDLSGQRNSRDAASEIRRRAISQNLTANHRRASLLLASYLRGKENAFRDYGVTTASIVRPLPWRLLASASASVRQPVRERCTTAHYCYTKRRNSGVGGQQKGGQRANPQSASRTRPALLWARFRVVLPSFQFGRGLDLLLELHFVVAGYSDLRIKGCCCLQLNRSRV